MPIITVLFALLLAQPELQPGTTTATGVVRLESRNPIIIGAGGSESWSFQTLKPSASSEAAVQLRRESETGVVLELVTKEPTRGGMVERELLTEIGRIELFDDGVSVYATWYPASNPPEQACPLPDVQIRETKTGRELILRPLLQGPAGPESVVFVLDASGSMAGKRLKAAKEALDAAAKSFPEGSEVSLIVLYDCGEVRREVDFGDGSRLLEIAVAGIQAKGGTPLGDALDGAFRYLHASAKHASERRRLIVLSDGLSTCGQNPSDVVGEWPASLRTAQTFVVVGLDLPEDESSRLLGLARQAQGRYIRAGKETLGPAMMKAAGSKGDVKR